MRRRMMGGAVTGVELLLMLMVMLVVVLMPPRLVGAQRAVATVRATITGTVYDSIGRAPLANATVRLVQANAPSIGQSATTDLYGRFKYDSVGAGRWLATFLHPVLDSLRLEPGIVQVDINESGPIALAMATPSPRALVLFNCRGPQAADVGLIVGDVRASADGAPLVGATVEMEWPEWELQRGRMVTDLKRRRATTDAAGKYALCGAPRGATLRGVSFTAADTSGSLEVITPEAGYTIVDFAIAPLERISIKVDSASNPGLVATVRRGKAVVRGRVTTLDRRPIANAIVRVIGSGSQVRSGADGNFVIVDAGAGTQTVEARAIGYQPMRQATQLSEQTPTAVALRLPIQRVQLDTVRVVAGRQLTPDLRSIERRWRSGTGTVLNGTLIRERSAIFVSDALRGVAGVTVRQVGGFGQAVYLRRADGNECQANVILDGAPIPPSQSASLTIDEFVRRDDIAAIEVYARPSQIPAEFTTMTSGCGLLAVWTKRATGGVTPERPKPRAP
jgi:hypothetical protein